MTDGTLDDNVMIVLCNQPRAFASDLDDDQSLYNNNNNNNNTTSV